MIRFIHWRDDFSLTETFYRDDGSGRTAIPVPEHVEICYFTPVGHGRFVASRNGNVFENCSLSADGYTLTVNLSLRSFPVGHGRLLRIATVITEDPAFPDGLKYTRFPSKLDVVLYDGKSDGPLDIASDIIFNTTIMVDWSDITGKPDFGQAAFRNIGTIEAGNGGLVTGGDVFSLFNSYTNYINEALEDLDIEIAGDLTRITNRIEALESLFEEINLGTEEDPAWAVRLKKKDGTLDRSFVTYGDQIVLNGTPGSGGGSGATPYLHELQDVEISDIAAGQILQWSGEKWVNVDAPSGSVTNVSLEQGASDGTFHLVVNGVAGTDVPVKGLDDSLSVISRALQSFQSQIDAVSARDMFDELTATVVSSDTITATEAYMGYAHASRYYLTDSIYFWAESVNGVMCARLNAPLITAGDQIVISGTPGGGGGGGAEYLYELEDVSLDNLSSGQMLRWNGSSWVNVDVPSGFITSIVLAEGAYNGTMRLVVNGVAQEDVSVKGYGSDLAIVSDALQSLQAQIDSVATRNNFDEIAASTIFSDIVSAGTFIGELDGNAATASLLVGSSYGVGSPGLPVYFSGGLPVACSGASIFPSVASTAEANLSLTIAGQARTIEDLYATFDDSGENIAKSFGVVSDALRSLQSQIDAVSARNNFDELTATSFYTDVMATTYAYAERYYLTDDVYFSIEKINGTACVLLNAPFITDGDQIIISGTPGGGGQGVGYLYELEDVSDALASPTSGMVLFYNGTEWVGVAASSIGGVTSVVGQTGAVTTAQIANALTAAGYKLTDTITTSLAWSAITNTPTTLAGYGITDAASASAISALTTRVGTLESDEAVVSTAIQSLQSQIDSVSARDQYDELAATVLFADTLSASSAYIESITGSLSGNAATASRLVGASYNAGNVNKPVYFSGGLPVETTYAIYASLYNGTAGRLAYYSANNLVSDFWNTIGSANQPIYLSNGVPVACTYTLQAALYNGTAGRLAYYAGANLVSDYYNTIGGATQPIYINAGVPTASTSTVGSASLPVYLNAGTITACTASSMFSALGSNTVNNLEVTVAGQLRTITGLYATYDGAGEVISDKFTIVSDALQSLQSQVDSVSAKNGYDELYAAVGYFDMLSVGCAIGGNLQLLGNLSIVGSLQSTGDQVVTSDITKKTNLNNITISVKQIACAPAVTFDWKAGGHSFGSIAQYWISVLPESVLGSEGDYGLAYGQLALVNTIALAKHETEQDREIKRLKKRVKFLENKVKQLMIN